MSNFVFLIDSAKTPINPIHPAQARKLLESGKAAVFRRFPFTLIMNRVVENIVTHPLALKLDPGSRFTGVALVNNLNQVIWGMELEHRGLAIQSSLLARAAVRRARRNRNTRYRRCKFKFGVEAKTTRPKGWLAPSLMHRVLTVMTWVNRLVKFAPITEIRQELVRFDLQQLENPEISGVEYQQGTLHGYEVREYLLNKWDRKCAYCSAENIPLQIEHIQPKSRGGTNRISNLCLACEKCNLKKGTQDIQVFLAKKPELLKQILAQAKRPMKDAAAVNATRWALLNALKKTGLPVTTGSGGLTKFNRTRLGLPKTHWLDAACVGDTPALEVLTTKPLTVRTEGRTTRRVCRMDRFGFPCSKPRQKYNTPWQTGDIGKAADGVVGRVVVQHEKRIEIRVKGERHYCKLETVKPIHKKDGYRYG